ncbi:MAG: hypothetical protein MJE68_31905 [Proteobacteria bacterium]|nr:hypothetical protein [Pseudomonadota bacterium]
MDSPLHPLSRQKVEQNYSTFLKHLEKIEMCCQSVFKKHPTLLVKDCEKFSRKMALAQLFVIGQQKLLYESKTPSDADPSTNSAPEGPSHDYDAGSEYSAELSYDSLLTHNSAEETLHSAPCNSEQDDASSSTSHGVDNKSFPKDSQE